MKTTIETNIASTLTLESGFRFRQAVFQYDEERNHFKKVASSAANTYQDDWDGSVTIPMPEGKLALVSYSGNHTDVALRGFSHEELESPAPDGVVIQTAPNWEDERWEIPVNRGAYLRAHVTGDARTIAQLVKGKQRLLMEDLGYAVEIPYVWGHQHSSSFIVFPSDGKPYIVSGCGHSAPEYIAEEGRIGFAWMEVE